PQAVDYYYFVTEDIGKRFLSRDYRRLLGLLQSFDRIEGYPAGPRRVADLGGGTGVVGLYLAARRPASQVVVYDHSPRQLHLGRQWAQEQHLGHVGDVPAGYQQLAGEPEGGDNDLVVFFFGLNPNASGPGPNEDEQAAMGALARLLSPGGVGVISVALTPERAGYLFEALRRAGLGVD